MVGSRSARGIEGWYPGALHLLDRPFMDFQKDQVRIEGLGPTPIPHEKGCVAYEEEGCHLCASLSAF